MPATIDALLLDAFSSDVRERRRLVDGTTPPNPPVLFADTGWLYLQPVQKNTASYWRKARVATSTSKFADTQHVWVHFNGAQVASDQRLLFKWFTQVLDRDNSSATVYVQEYLKVLFYDLFEDELDWHVDTEVLKALVKKDATPAPSSGNATTSKKTAQQSTSEKTLLQKYENEYDARSTTGKQHNLRLPENLLTTILYLQDLVREELPDAKAEDTLLQTLLGNDNEKKPERPAPLLSVKDSTGKWVLTLPPGASVDLGVDNIKMVQDTALSSSWMKRAEEIALREKPWKRSRPDIKDGISDFFGVSPATNLPAFLVQQAIVAFYYTKVGAAPIAGSYVCKKVNVAYKKVALLHFHRRRFQPKEELIFCVYEPFFSTAVGFAFRLRKHDLGNLARKIWDKSFSNSVAELQVATIKQTEKHDTLTPNIARDLHLRIFTPRDIFYDTLVLLDKKKVTATLNWPNDNDGFYDLCVAFLSDRNNLEEAFRSLKMAITDQLLEFDAYDVLDLRKGLSAEIFRDNAVFTKLANKSAVTKDEAYEVNFKPLVINGEMFYTDKRLVDNYQNPLSVASYLRTSPGDDDFALRDVFIVELSTTNSDAEDLFVVRLNDGTFQFIKENKGPAKDGVVQPGAKDDVVQLGVRLISKESTTRINLSEPQSSVSTTVDCLEEYLQKNEPDVYNNKMRVVATESLTRRELLLCLKNWFWTTLFAKDKSYAAKTFAVHTAKKKLSKIVETQTEKTIEGEALTLPEKLQKDLVLLPADDAEINDEIKNAETINNLLASYEQREEWSLLSDDQKETWKVALTNYQENKDESTSTATLNVLGELMAEIEANNPLEQTLKDAMLEKLEEAMVEQVDLVEDSSASASTTAPYNHAVKAWWKAQAKAEAASSQLWLAATNGTRVHLTTQTDSIAINVLAAEKEWTDTVSVLDFKSSVNTDTRKAIWKTLLWTVYKKLVAELTRHDTQNQRDTATYQCIFIQPSDNNDSRLSQNVAVWYGNALMFNREMAQEGTRYVSCLKCEMPSRNEDYTKCHACTDNAPTAAAQSSNKNRLPKDTVPEKKYKPIKKKPGRFRRK